MINKIVKPSIGKETYLSHLLGFFFIPSAFLEEFDLFNILAFFRLIRIKKVII